VLPDFKKKVDAFFLVMEIPCLVEEVSGKRKGVGSSTEELTERVWSICRPTEELTEKGWSIRRPTEELTE